jgi:hypothetical protein
MTAWAILEYENGRHTAIPNSLARLGILAVLPMVSDKKNIAGRPAPVEVHRPALHSRLFIIADEQKVQVALGRVRYTKSVWRAPNGDLRTIPDAELQSFLDFLSEGAKKAKKPRKYAKMAEFCQGDESDKYLFDLYERQFGTQEAVKQLGRDLRDLKVA